MKTAIAICIAISLIGCAPQPKPIQDQSGEVLRLKKVNEQLRIDLKESEETVERMRIDLQEAIERRCPVVIKPAPRTLYVKPKVGVA